MPLGKRLTPSASVPKNYEKAAPDPAPGIPDAPAAVHNEKQPENSEPVMFRSREPEYDFDSIVLNKNVYNAIQDALALYEKHDLIFDQWGFNEKYKNQSHAGINLYGYSGTGKSMAANAIAGQLGRKILTVDYSQIESKYVGETSKNLAALFDHAMKTHSVIFFDEADALLSKRVTNMSNSTDVSVNQTRSVLLMLINDFDDLIIFASNFISNYDPAFMRRITAHIKFDLPDASSRYRLWEMYIPKEMPADVSISELVSKYCNVSGADISNAVLNAALKAARLNDPVVPQAYFEEAMDRIVKSKADNSNTGEITSKRVVSEEYVKSQFGGDLPL